MPELAIADRVREVIARAGLTHASFASSVDMDPTKLSKSLAGSRRFTSLELALIADFADVTVDWLLTGREDRAPHLAARVGTSGRLDDAVARARAYDDVYEVLERVGYGRPESPRTPSPRRTGRNVDQGTALAAAARRAIAEHGLEERARRALPAVVESVFGIDVGVENLPGEPDGLCYSRDGFRLALVSNSKSWTRQRFTLSHELGHILAGDAQELQLDEDVFASNAQHKATEMRANAFAAALLMPEDLLRSAFGDGVDQTRFAKAVGNFGVSPSALAWRMLNVSLIDDTRRRELGAMSVWEAAEKGEWLDENIELVQEQTMTRAPSDLLDRAHRAYRAGKISARPLATILNIDPEEFLEGEDLSTRGGATGDQPAFIP